MSIYYVVYYVPLHLRTIGSLISQFIVKDLFDNNNKKLVESIMLLDNLIWEMYLTNQTIKKVAHFIKEKGW